MKPRKRTIVMISVATGDVVEENEIYLENGIVSFKVPDDAYNEIPSFPKPSKRRLTPKDGEEYFNGLFLAFRSPYLMAVEKKVDKKKHSI